MMKHTCSLVFLPSFYVGPICRIYIKGGDLKWVGYFQSKMYFTIPSFLYSIDRYRLRGLLSYKIKDSITSMDRGKDII